MSTMRVTKLRPRRIVKKLADDVFAQIGMDKDLEIARARADRALRRLGPRKLY